MVIHLISKEPIRLRIKKIRSQLRYQQRSEQKMIRSLLRYHRRSEHLETLSTKPRQRPLHLVILLLQIFLPMRLPLPIRSEQIGTYVVKPHRQRL